MILTRYVGALARATPRFADIAQVLAAVDVCGTDGTITLNEGDFNITR